MGGVGKRRLTHFEDWAEVDAEEGAQQLLLIDCAGRTEVSQSARNR